MELRVLRYFLSVAREGLGCLLAFDRLVDTGPDSPLCFRPLTPPLHSRLFFVWKKYAMFSPAAAVLLGKLPEGIRPGELR